jgi:hypothetical protein
MSNDTNSATKRRYRKIDTNAGTVTVEDDVYSIHDIGPAQAKYLLCEAIWQRLRVAKDRALTWNSIVTGRRLVNATPGTVKPRKPRKERAPSALVQAIAAAITDLDISIARMDGNPVTADDVAAIKLDAIIRASCMTKRQKNEAAKSADVMKHLAALTARHSSIDELLDNKELANAAD